MVWGVAKGSLLNKVILVPLALVISAFAPWLITPLLMLGGAYLCYEGIEKVVEWVMPGEDKKSPEARQARLQKLNEQQASEYEKKKIKGAIKTDFILSAEIVTLTLGIVSQAPLLNQVLVMSGVALVVTLGVYGLVAMIVKIDDLGYWLEARRHHFAKTLGKFLLFTAPWLMKFLSVAGTLAMFLVGGGILIHGWPQLHHLVASVTEDWPTLLIHLTDEIFAPLVVGALLGFAVMLVVGVIKRLFKRG